MTYKIKFISAIAASVFLCACTHYPATSSDQSPLMKEIPSVVQTVTEDNVTLYGTPYFGELDPSAPLLLLFHQGGSNARGEYGPIVPWLNEAGFRVLAWDLRNGGDIYGMENRTVVGLSENTPNDYCDAYPDLQAALEYIRKNDLAKDVTIWGSSYSGALIFRLAKDNPDFVKAVVAFSPASGGPLKDCRARMWAKDIDTPMKVYKPVSEMSRESSQTQKALLEEAGVTFEIIENGIHGSSMLVDERTDADMSEARASVIKWLREQEK